MLRITYNEFTKWGLSRMKNRDRYILKVNEHDMLMKIQANIIDGDCCCIIDALTGDIYPSEDGKRCTLDACKECIQKWLNKES